MFKKTLLIILLLKLSPAIGTTRYTALSDSETATIKARLQEVAGTTDTISSNFVQTKNLTILKEKIISKGKFFFKKENKIRWEYSKPYKYTIIFNGEKIQINNEGRKNTFDIQSNAVFQEVNTMILNSIKGDILQVRNSYTMLFYKNRLYMIIQLRPLSSVVKKYIDYIQIFFNKKDYQVSKLNIYELSGDYTEIVFTNKKINKTIPDSIFIFD